MVVAVPFNRKTIEDAILTWFASSTGLDCFWQNGRAPEAPYPFGTLTWLATTRNGSQDETRVEDAVGPTPGEEITISACGLRRIDVSCHVYAVNADRESAAEYLERAQIALALPTPLALLRAAGVAVTQGRGATIRSLPMLVRADWVGHAQMDVAFGVAGNVAERTTYVEFVEVTPTVDDVDLPTATFVVVD